jgi:ABC-type Zn uptake system ZnuABC Zn-binding protein ZnuA
MKKLAFLSLIPALFLLVLVGCQQTTNTEDGKKLSVTKPSDVTIKRGDTATVNVSISRGGFRDAVNVKFEDLPKGVKVQDADTKIASGETSAKFTLKAADDAELGEKTVKVVVTGTGGIKADEAFKATVKDK